MAAEHENVTTTDFFMFRAFCQHLAVRFSLLCLDSGCGVELHRGGHVQDGIFLPPVQNSPERHRGWTGSTPGRKYGSVSDSRLWFTGNFPQSSDVPSMQF